MHELPVTERILSVVLTHAYRYQVNNVCTIRLEIGGLSDLEDDWIQRYFDYVSKDTIAAGAHIEIERKPVEMHCNGCGSSFNPDLKNKKKVRCPYCKGSEIKLISGNEYHIKNIEVV